MYIYQMHAVYNTCCFPSPSATQPPPPFLSPPGRPKADGSPIMGRGSALGSLLINREFLLATVAIVLSLRGPRLWALLSTWRQLQWGKQVFEPLPISQVWPLAKKCVIYNCNSRCILTVRNRIYTKQSRKLHFITFMT